MRRAGPPVVVAVSGPDGAGKSSLVTELRAALRLRGLCAVTVYCYGCVFCRRFGPPGATGTDRPGRRVPARLSSLLGWPHAVVDAAELAGRLLAARLRVRIAARRRSAAIVTDRGPLDGLVKFDPAPGSWPAALFTHIGRGYGLTLLLDAGPDVLAKRDGDHTPARLDELRRRYRRWERHLPRVADLGTEAQPPESAVPQALRLMFGDGQIPARAMGGAVRKGGRHAG